ncbi:condensation domain-containing protein, partial [Nocardia farcinica]|uniref:condensation domain-containing protein n=1 Tax=Nocardia farcinica TaxID=37329 RepID=UPI0024586161
MTGDTCSRDADGYLCYHGRWDDMIGMFVNTLVFRTQVRPGDAFTDLLAEVRERDLQAFAHADV